LTDYYMGAHTIEELNKRQEGGEGLRHQQQGRHSRLQLARRPDDGAAAPAAAPAAPPPSH
jgi:hypothetical protein